MMPFSELNTVVLLAGAVAVIVIWIGNRALWRRAERRALRRRFIKEVMGK